MTPEDEDEIFDLVDDLFEEASKFMDPSRCCRCGENINGVYYIDGQVFCRGCLQ